VQPLRGTKVARRQQPGLDRPTIGQFNRLLQGRRRLRDEPEEGTHASHFGEAEVGLTARQCQYQMLVAVVEGYGQRPLERVVVGPFTGLATAGADSGRRCGHGVEPTRGHDRALLGPHEVGSEVGQRVVVGLPEEAICQLEGACDGILELVRVGRGDVEDFGAGVQDGELDSSQIERPRQVDEHLVGASCSDDAVQVDLEDVDPEVAERAGNARQLAWGVAQLDTNTVEIHDSSPWRCSA
jgi:hypothetical protein